MGAIIMHRCEGNSKGKIDGEITALKAEIVTMERRQAYMVATAVQKAEGRLAIECENVVKEERARADQIEEQRNVAMLQNELLTEMVAAEQVNVKLQERRNQALKWELLRQGGTQEKFENIAKEVPKLGETLGADTAEVLQYVAKHDMAEAIEYVVCKLKEVEDDLMQAFLARDKGRTGALGSSDFKDALRECLPDMPREDRHLLMLRFIQEVDQSLYYEEFLEFCRRKAQSRERLKMGLTGALAATRSVAYRGGTCSLGDAGALAATTPSEERQPFSATALTLSRCDDLSTSTRDIRQFVGGRHRRGTETASFSNQGTVADPESAVLAERKTTGIIARRGADMELLFKKADPARSGVIPVKAFSQCLRCWDINNSTEGNMQEEQLLLTRSDRKALYRKWVVHGQVRYDDFLRAGGYFDIPSPRYSQVSTTDLLPPPPRRETPPPLHRNADTESAEEIRTPRLQVLARPPPEEADGESLAARTEVVLVHLSEVLEKEGEEAFFETFEGRDAEDCRSLNEDGFMDAITDFAPEVTTKQALDVFRARSREVDGGLDYDRLFKELIKISQPKYFQLGDKVQLAAEDRGGRVHWVGAEALRKDTPRRKEKRKSVADFTTKVTSWFAGLSKPSTSVNKTRTGWILTRLKHLFGPDEWRARANVGAHRTRDSSITKRKRQPLKESNGAVKLVSGNRADDEARNYGRHRHRLQYRQSRRWSGDHNELPEESTNSSEQEHAHRTPRRCRSDTTAVDSKTRDEGENDSSGSTSDTEWANGDNVSKKSNSSYRQSTTILGRNWSGSGGDSNGGEQSGGERGGGKGTRSARSSSRRISELPVIQEVPSLPRDKRHPSQGHHRERSLPSIPRRRSLRDQGDRSRASQGRSRMGSNGGLTVGERGQRRNNDLKSYEALRDGSMEGKFDLYKKRIKDALSPERRFDGSGTTSSFGNRTQSDQK